MRGAEPAVATQGPVYQRRDARIDVVADLLGRDTGQPGEIEGAKDYFPAVVHARRSSA
jgi:hypothetical protein